MSLPRPFIILAGAALAGIALVGVGASATFTDSTTSSQKISAGHLNMVVSSAAVPGCANADYGCKSLTLPAVGPVGSTFETPATDVYITNKGDVASYFDAIQMSATTDASAPSLALLNQSDVCIMSTDASGTWTEGNGPLTVATALNPTVKQNPVKLEPGQSAKYSVNFYAGQQSRCGAKYSDGTNTTNAWTGYIGHGYQAPASLTDAAQGGSFVATLTFSFTG